MPVFLSGKSGVGTYKYQYMFRNCKKLKNVNSLPDVIPYAQIYNSTF